MLFNENNKNTSIIKISLISFLSSLPIIVNMIYEINIIGFINNIFFIPYVSSIVFPLSLLTFIFSILTPILNIFLTIMERVSFISSQILNICVFFSKISLFELVLYYILLILIIKKKRVKILFVMLLLIMYFKPYFNNDTNIYFTDVSQGDSALIVTNNNRSILIDTGGSISYESESWKKKNKTFNLMKSSIIPFYKSIGLKKIDYAFFSHGDSDHIGYAKDLIDNFKVVNKYINNDSINNYEIELNALKYDKNHFKIDNVEIINLNNKMYDNENDNSLVLLIKIDNYKILFMGDASIKVENDLIDEYDLKNIDILKVGHHGSDTSTSKEFVNKINPKYCIISVGENNKYNHPSKEVLYRLNDCKIYRTDKDGSIIFKIKNNKLTIETLAPYRD